MKILVKALFLLLGGLVLATTQAEAQQISIGGGVGYGSKAENANVQVNFYYRLSSLPMRIGADGSYSIPDKSSFSGGETRRDLVDGNLNLHLMAIDTDLFSMYSITGLNMTYNRLKTDFDDGSSISASDTFYGFNIGVGTELEIGKGRWFGEAKYLIREDSDESEFVVGAGMRIRI